MTLDLRLDAVALTETLCNISSVSHDEERIAGEIAGALAGLGHLTVTRLGNTLVARTDLGRSERVVIAGHIDTVPLNDNLPVRNDG
ncbi:MAG: succinyl-diaminopimelate desuccinylase [Nocardioidaceae bacterium]|nr:succinyl-diaminopimelate desuccinylase [Nocardioidaceae bacterium]